MECTQPDPQAETPIPEVAIEYGDYQAIISGSGAAVSQFTYSGRPLLRGFAAGTHPPESCNVILAPWPNRVADGAFTFDGQHHQLEITEPERDNAIHGFTDRLVGEVTRTSPASARVTMALGPRPGWPWSLELTVDYHLDHDGLTGVARVVNTADSDCPFAFGAHTYLEAQGHNLDECVLAGPHMRNLPLDQRMRPAGDQRAWGPRMLDMGGVELDHAFVLDRAAGRADAADEVSGDAEGAEFTLSGPDGQGVRLTCDDTLGWVQIYTSPERHIAVEPMSAPPNALASGVDLLRLKPQGSAEFRWTVAATHQ